MSSSTDKILLTLAIGILIGLTSSYFFMTRDSISNFSHLSKTIVRCGVQQNKLQATAYRDTAVADRLSQEVRVLCWIMTMPENHDAKAKHVKETWGRRCTKLLFMSSVEDKYLPAVALNVTEGRSHLWTKTKQAFRYVYEHHFDDADWFLKADDDTFVIMENLRYMLAAHNSSDHTYFGFRFKPYIKQGYMSGGAGYVLSRAALDVFVNDGLYNNVCTNIGKGTEDKELGVCLEKLGVKAMDTRDVYGLQRFLPLSAGDRLKKTNSLFHRLSYYPAEDGPNCCSYSAISFHYTKPGHMHVMEYFLYRLQPYGIFKLPTAGSTTNTQNVISV